MIIGNRTLTTRYILPFIFNSNKIFKETYGFVNAFVTDINKPYFDNHIFVVYEYIPSTYDTVNSYICSNPYYYDTRHIYIDNKFYIEYIMLIPPKYKEIITSIKEGYYNCLSSNSINTIFDFWKNNDTSYLKDLLESKTTFNSSLESKGEVVTEEDYIE